ncbi:MAG TPA: hypothetical protein VIX17_04480 [Pyrinomonadaceae bacterium]|jgi:hypothetical protein
MPKQMIKMLSMLMLLAVVALTATAVSAQTTRRVAANIPFSFIVGDKELPAGRYGIQPTSVGSGILRILGTENSKSAVRLTSSLRRNDSGRGKLVFHRYQDQYFLSEIWATGEPDGRLLVKSNREKQMQREQLASNSSKQAYQVIEVMVVGQ